MTASGKRARASSAESAPAQSSARAAVAASAQTAISAITLVLFLMVITAIAVAVIAIAVGLYRIPPPGSTCHQHIEANAHSAQSMSATEAGRAPRRMPRTMRLPLKRSRERRTT